jgi:hypothetical protein
MNTNQTAEQVAVARHQIRVTATIMAAMSGAYKQVADANTWEYELLAWALLTLELRHGGVDSFGALGDSHAYRAAAKTAAAILLDRAVMRYGCIPAVQVTDTGLSVHVIGTTIPMNVEPWYVAAEQDRNRMVA